MIAAGKVVVTDHNFPNLKHEQAAAHSCGAGFRAHNCTAAKEVAEVLRGADLAFVQLAPVSAEAVASMNRGAVIVRYGVGIDNLPLAACGKFGVRVCNVPDYGLAEVADHAAALLLSLHRRLPQLDSQVRNGGWDAVGLCGAVPPLSSLTLGLFGFGRIGRQLLHRMLAFNMCCSVHDPFVEGEVIRAAGGVPVDKDELLAKSDMLSLHAPHVPGSEPVISGASLAKMKKNAILVNCARGELIDEAALAAALGNGTIAAAGLDVFADEPLRAGSPLRTAPNILLTAHAAWCSAASIPRLQRLAAEEGVRALRGEPLRCEISLPKL